MLSRSKGFIIRCIIRRSYLCDIDNYYLHGTLWYLHVNVVFMWKHASSKSPYPPLNTPLLDNPQHKL